MTGAGTRRSLANEPPRGGGVAALALGEGAARALAFGAGLVVARRLGPEMYGVIGVSAGILLYLQQLADQGVELAGVPDVARGDRDIGALGSSTLTFRVLVAAVLAVAVVAASRWFLPEPDGRVLALYAWGLILTGASTRWMLLGLQRAGSIAAARILGEAIALAAVLALVRSADDLLAVPASAVAGLAVTTGLLLLGTRRAGIRLAPDFRWRECRGLLARGRPLVVFTMLGLVLFNFDLIFLRFVQGEAAAGLYAAAYAFVSFASNLMVAYAHAVMPALTRAVHGREGGDDVYHRAVAHATALVLPAAVGAAFVSAPLLELVFGARFSGSAIALQLLALTLPLASTREIAVAAVVAAGGERGLVRVNATTVVANVLLVLALVPNHGIAGAALATLATELVRLALAARLARSLGFQLPPPSRYLKPAVAALAMLAALLVAGPSPLWRSIGTGVVAYGSVLLVLGGIRVRRGALPEVTV